MDTSKNVVLGDDLEITCDVSGYPYPTVNWFKDGKPLMSDKRITLSDNGVYRKAILGINNLEFEDKGEYTCTATSPENPLGVTATIDISVKGKSLKGKFWTNPKQYVEQPWLFLFCEFLNPSRIWM